mmetsp:Transcript_28806/g.75911  ORF Transcript_28806/g.75911 Transcript_28806/m.75911 type:complete len:215 (-) Transcript_28806:283-927(-)
MSGVWVWARERLTRSRRPGWHWHCISSSKRRSTGEFSTRTFPRGSLTWSMRLGLLHSQLQGERSVASCANKCQATIFHERLSCLLCLLHPRGPNPRVPGRIWHVWRAPVLVNCPGMCLSGSKSRKIQTCLSSSDAVLVALWSWPRKAKPSASTVRLRCCCRASCLRAPRWSMWTMRSGPCSLKSAWSCASWRQWRSVSAWASFPTSRCGQWASR